METLRYVVLANGLLAVVSIAYYVLLRRETFFEANRLTLWLGLAASLILPLLELPDWRPQPIRTIMQRTAQVIVPTVLADPTVSAPDVTITFPNGRTYRALLERQTTSAVWSWQMGVVAIYVAVLLLLLVRFATQMISLRRLIRRSVHDAYDDFTLVRSVVVTSPFSFFGWVVLNPAVHEPDELEQILRHERVHVRERHSLDMVATELVCIAGWFNPAVYLFRYLLRQTLEFSADRAVLAEGVDAQAYQYNLVKVSLAGGSSVPTNHFSQSQLKSRIVMLNKPDSSIATWLKYPAMCVATLAVAATFARKTPQTLTEAYLPATEGFLIAKHYEPLQTAQSVDPESVQTNNLLIGSADRDTFSAWGYAGRDATFNEIENTNKPMNTAYVVTTIAAEKNSPDTLRTLATDNSPAVNAIFDDKKMEHLLLEGQRKYGYLGMGFRRFNKEEIKQQSRPNSSLSVATDGSLAIHEESHTIRTYINNEPASHEAVQRLHIEQIYTVAVILGYDNATNKRTMTDYLLFYVDKGN